MSRLTLLLIKEAIPSNVVDALHKEGWSVEKVYEKVREALIKGGEIRKKDDPF